MQYQEDVIKLDNGKEVRVWRVNNDVYGNPRFVVHFSAIAPSYAAAHRAAKKAGGRKYTGKWFRGGFVFQSYDMRETLHFLTA